MKQRINIQELEPESCKPMIAFEKYLSTISLENTLKDLVKVRASIINRCAYCIQMHTTAARQAGETEQRLYALSAWKESPLFTEKEQALLAMTDEVTKISDNGLTDETYEQAKNFFDDNTIAQVIMAIITINSWNRIALSTRMFHEN